MNNAENVFGSYSGRFQMPICKKTITTELSNDYTLPDYLGEIRKVLRISASVSPSSKYVKGNTAEFNGNIEYTLLYVGTDGELYATALPAEYSFSVPLEISGAYDLSEGINLFSESVDESLTTRVTSPRKLNVKCRLNSQIEGYGILVSEERITGEADIDSLVRLKKEAIISSAVCALCDPLEISADVDIQDPNTRVISGSCCIRINETIPSEDLLDIRGEATISLIVSEKDSSPVRCITKSVPFEKRLEIDGMSSRASLKLNCFVSDLSISVNDNDIHCEIEILPDIIAYNDNSLSYTEDIYSTERSSECAYKDLSIQHVSSVEYVNFSQSERIPLSDTVIPQGSQTIEVLCKPSIDKIDEENGKAIIYGQCKYSVITHKDGEYSGTEIPLGFKYVCGKDEAKVVEARVSVISAKLRLDGGNLAVDTELSIRKLCANDIDVKTVSEVRFGDLSEKRNGDIILCFPSTDDTPWSVSKRYQVSPDALKGIGSSTDSLDTTPYILINS